MPKVLLIGKSAIREDYEDGLASLGYTISTFNSLDKVIKGLHENIDILIADKKLSSEPSFKTFLRLSKSVPKIVISDTRAFRGFTPWLKEALDSPVYNTKYVYVYDSTPEVVYVGYYPGYTGCYAYGGTVIYGTGYYYPPYYGAYYYPRPVTYGFSAHYNPYTGWSFGFGMSFGGPYGWMSFGYSSYPYHGGYWGAGGYHGGYSHGYYDGRRAGFYAGYRYGQNNQISHYNDGNRNVYNGGNKGNINTNDRQRNNVSTMDRQRDNVSTMDKQRNNVSLGDQQKNRVNTNNNVFADK